MKKNPFVSLITKTLTSAATSVVSSELKKRAKGFIENLTAKTPEQARAEAAARLGYETDSFVLDKKQNVVFKSSSLFISEWLKHSPITAGKILRDEETGDFFFKDKLLSDSTKNELVEQFVKITKVTSPAVNSHFESALNRLPLTDFTATRFAKEFSGWQPGRTSVIDSWLSNAFGEALETDNEYATMLFRKWIIGTANRALNPGSTLDGCLTFQGPTGVGKTQFFRKILPEPFDGRTGEVYCNVREPSKLVEAIVKKTVACFDELSVLENTKIEETFKSVLTSQFVDVRLAWARKPRRFALRNGFGATVNKKNFLIDRTLSRRLWTIELNGKSRLNFNFVNDNRKALWMEAVFLATKDKDGSSYILSPDEQRLVEERNKIFHS